MKKMIVATTGAFGLGDMQARQEIDAFRPSVVQPSQFLSSRIGLGQVNILVDDLPDEANDDAFKACLAECGGDIDLALDSYTAEVSGAPKKKAETKVKVKSDVEPSTEVEAESKKPPVKK